MSQLYYVYVRDSSLKRYIVDARSKAEARRVVEESDADQLTLDHTVDGLWEIENILTEEQERDRATGRIFVDDDEWSDANDIPDQQE